MKWEFLWVAGFLIDRLFPIETNIGANEVVTKANKGFGSAEPT
jgi:hypothetical protein